MILIMKTKSLLYKKPNPVFIVNKDKKSLFLIDFDFVKLTRPLVSNEVIELLFFSYEKKNKDTVDELVTLEKNVKYFNSIPSFAKDDFYSLVRKIDDCILIGGDKECLNKELEDTLVKNIIICDSDYELSSLLRIYSLLRNIIENMI